MRAVAGAQSWKPEQRRSYLIPTIPTLPSGKMERVRT